MQKSEYFYEQKDPTLALEIYLHSLDNVYDRCKNEMIKQLCGALPTGTKVLDAGCGGGYFSVYFAGQGANVVGIDASPASIAAARILADREGVGNRCTFAQADITDFKLEERFDLILAKDVVEHIEDDAAALDNMRVHLKGDGTLVVTTQNKFSANYIIEGCYRKFRCGEKNWLGWDPGHLRFYTAASLGKKLRQAGFKIEKWASVYHFPYRFLSEFFFGRIYESGWFHITEIIAGKCFPFNVTGWSLMARCIKARNR